MALEHDVEALITRVRTLTERVRHLEEMLTGPTIKLEAGGSSVVISPQGIVLDSSQNLMIRSAGSLTLRGQKRVLIDTPMEYEVSGARGLRDHDWRQQFHVDRRKRLNNGWRNLDRENR